MCQPTFDNVRGPELYWIVVQPVPGPPAFHFPSEPVPANRSHEVTTGAEHGRKPNPAYALPYPNPC
jgi:hypothetical protein